MSHSADTPLGMPAPWLDGTKIVVTGGTGFVGRHLLPQLVAAGARVTCITRATSRRDHLPAGVEVVRADLRSGAGLEEALRVFDGIALYDGTWELDEDTLEYFRRHYGMVSL